MDLLYVGWMDVYGLFIGEWVVLFGIWFIFFVGICCRCLSKGLDRCVLI